MEHSQPSSAAKILLSAEGGALFGWWAALDSYSGVLLAAFSSAGLVTEMS